LTLTAIRVDRLLALSLGLRYRQVLTLKRAYLIVVTFWIVSTLFATMQVSNVFEVLGCTIVVCVFCLVTSTSSYTNIFLTLRHRQSQVQEHVQQPSQTNYLNKARYKKAVSTALCLKFRLLACYLPEAISTTLLMLVDHEPSLSSSVSLTILVFLNSSLNPVL